MREKGLMKWSLYEFNNKATLYVKGNLENQITSYYGVSGRVCTTPAEKVCMYRSDFSNCNLCIINATGGSIMYSTSWISCKDCYVQMT